MTNMTLFDFVPEKVEERNREEEEDQQVRDLLGRFSAEMLKDALRADGGHPRPEWGDGETWRFFYLDECRRRGTRLLEQLGWPTDEDALYVNIYTGGVDCLIDIATTHGYFADRHTISDQVWSVIEHWEPFNPEQPNHYRIEYLEHEIERLKQRINNRTDGPTYIKMDKRNLKEAEAELESEKRKLR